LGNANGSRPGTVTVRESRPNRNIEYGSASSIWNRGFCLSQVGAIHRSYPAATCPFGRSRKFTSDVAVNSSDGSTRLKSRQSTGYNVAQCHSWRDGTTHVIFEPLDFIARPAVLIPKPRLRPTCSTQSELPRSPGVPFLDIAGSCSVPMPEINRNSASRYQAGCIIRPLPPRIMPLTA